MSELYGWPKIQSLTDVLSINSLDLTKEIGIEKILIPCDVTNPLCGEIGAARMFGPQKGAKSD